MPLINSLLSTTLGSKAILSPTLHRMNMMVRGLMSAGADFQPSMLQRFLAAIRLTPEEKRALTYVNTTGVGKALGMPPEIKDLYESAVTKMEGVGIGRPLVRQMAPGLGVRDTLVGAEGPALGKVLTKDMMKKVDPTDYVFRVSEKFTPKELDVLATAKAMAEGKTVTPPSHVINQFARRGVQFDTRTLPTGQTVNARPWIVTPVNAKSNPELMTAADPLYKRLKGLGLSDETIQQRLSFGDVPEHTNPLTTLTRMIIPALTAGAVGSLVGSRASAALGGDAEPTTLPEPKPDVPPVHYSSIAEMMDDNPGVRARKLAPVLRALEAPAGALTATPVMIGNRQMNISDLMAPTQRLALPAPSGLTGQGW